MNRSNLLTAQLVAAIGSPLADAAVHPLARRPLC
jgi:hypothetical protein